MGVNSRTALAGALLCVLASGPGAAQQAEGSHIQRSAGGGHHRNGDRFLRANPSKVVAVEFALSQAAQDKGQWTAFADFATDDAVLFVPEAVSAKTWLKKRQNPAEAIRWQPHEIWSSCDGSLAISHGALQHPDGTVGYFITAWQRQKKGDYKWVMSQNETLAQPLAAPELIDGKSADCSTRPTPLPSAEVEATGAVSSGSAHDNSLHWDVVSHTDGSRDVTISYWTGQGWATAFHDQVSAGR